MTKSIDLLRRELHAFCELAEQRGWRITDRRFGDPERKKCCPLGAVGVVIHGTPNRGETTAEELMGSYDRVADFYISFDGYDRSGPYGALGREFRSYYIGGER
jgi:hypothetical protein